MGAFDRKYTDEQKDAVAHAYEDRRVRPASRVADLAARGALEWKGQALDPFQMGDDMVRECAKQLRRKRAGLQTSELAKAEPRDAVEALRRRMVNGADALLSDWERQVKQGKATAEDGVKIARLVRELAAIPGPKEPRKPAPGQHNPETGRNEAGGRTAGLAGSILHAARGETAQNAPHTQHIEGHRDTPGSAGVDAAQHDEDARDAALPGSGASVALLATAQPV